MERRTFLQLLAGAAVGPPAGAQELKLPKKEKSVRFAVIGDNGTGERPEYEVADQMAKYRESFGFEFVLMLGDNIYGGQSQADFKRKFEDPYKALLEAGVKFYACLGNHDSPNQRFYKPFNMEGRRYYDFRRGNTAFFALDSNYMDPDQIAWLRKELPASEAPWKICYFHHPLYSDSRAHGSDTDLRKALEPMFEEYGVRVVLNGHEHTYERVKAQNGIYYFVLGNSGQLRIHNLRKSPRTEKGYDMDRGFGLVEIAGGEFYFQIISRTGQTIDFGMYPLAQLQKGKAA